MSKEYRPPQFLNKENLQKLRDMIKTFQEETGVIVTAFSIKTPIIIDGFIMETELTMDVNPK